MWVRIPPPQFGDFMRIEDLKKSMQVKIKGWVHNKRSSGGIIFLLLRDGTGYLQCIGRKKILKKEKLKQLEHLSLESVVELYGSVKEDERAPGGIELEIEDFKILSKSQPHYPLQKQKMGVDYLLDNRHLWIRSEKMSHIMRVRAMIFKTAREWFKNNGFIELQAPIIVKAGSEGGAKLFKIDYFGKPAYLTQSWQLYGEAFIQAFGKSFTIAPVFRAEPSRTPRHLTEYWYIEAEIPFCGFDCLLDTEEKFIKYLVNETVKKAGKHLEALGRKPEEISIKKIPRVTYKDAIEILRDSGISIDYGDKIGADEEKVLSKHFKQPYEITHWPRELQPFYLKVDPKNPKEVLFVSMYAPEGYGELIDCGGERIENYEQLVERIKEKGLNPEDYKWYLDLRKWGAVQHSGFGLVVERLVSWLCGLEHIRDAVAFPRLINRVYP